MQRQIKKIVISCLIVGISIAGLIIFWRSSPISITAYDGLGMQPNYDIADNIINAPDNRTFASLIDTAEYTTFLRGEGPYTVFAPTENAYANLPDDSKRYLLDTSNRGALRQAILYHVVKGKFRYADLKDGITIKTVQGEDLKFTKKDGYLIINDYAYIQTYDVLSTNGVIHIITNYLIPPSALNE